MKSAPRYLVIAPQGLGDSLEATPFVVALRRAIPNSMIDVLVLRRPAKELFEGLPELVSSVIYLPYWESGLRAFLSAAVAQRWRAPYDATFLMYPAARPEYHLLSRLFPSKMRLAHRYAEPQFTTMLWLNNRLIPVEREHNVLRNLALLRAFGIPYEVPHAYAVPATWIAAKSARRESGIVIHVGTIAHNGLESRRWPLEHFAVVARSMIERGKKVTALIGPAEREETLELKKRVPELETFEGTLSQVARFLSNAEVVLANDSGIAHLAAGVRAPTVALFGPTPLEHAPYGPDVTALRPSDCPPCFDVRLLNTQCALNIDYRCIKRDLPPALVISAIENAIKSSSMETEADAIR